MNSANKSRRSARIPARHNIMLMVENKEGAAASKEVVTTVHISRHGAHLLGRKALQQDSKGKVAHLGTCRQAPFRIAWQAPSNSNPGFHEMGIEFVESADFWGNNYAEANTTPRPTQADAAEPITSPALSSAVLLDQLRLVPASPQGREIVDAIWCGLIEQLEERRVITRTELIGSLRKVGLQI